MSTRGFSRRDLLQLGGTLAMTVGAAKILIALPGCGDDGETARVDAPHPIDSPHDTSYYGHSLDDCHSLGTYQHNVSYNYYSQPYTYHYYFQHAYACPYYVSFPASGVYCYASPYPFPHKDYFCFKSSYYHVTMP